MYINNGFNFLKIRKKIKIVWEPNKMNNTIEIILWREC